MRPKYNTMAIFFGNVKDKNVDQIGDMLGGKVDQNIDAGTFQNACALRMSYALNKSGVVVPAQQGKTSSGDGGTKYFFRVKDLVSFLKLKFGKPEIDRKTPLAVDFPSKGILVFEVPFSDATGHVTVWDGKSSLELHGNYFGRATRAYLWKLP